MNCVLGEMDGFCRIIPTRGNHDIGKNFNEIFDSPGGKDNYYTTRLGSMLTLVTLNTEISWLGDQFKWMDGVFAKERKENRWLVTQYHRPVFPAVKKAPQAAKNWIKLFEKYNVDFALESDGHSLKRTVPVRNGKHDKTGVVYLGEGGLGVPQREARVERWYLQSPGYATSSHHLILLEVSKENVRSRFYDPSLRVRDEYVFKPRK